MEEPYDATSFLPQRETLQSLRDAASECRGCPLWCNATQTVFGEGRKRARVMFVGEAPGDREDRAGEPFVGPAGRELDNALEIVEIDRRDVYVTNVVKHFKFEERGKRRIHEKPNAREIRACRPWLDAELRVIQPCALILLGATASKALLGNAFRLTQQRGQPIDSSLAPLVIATIHPSAILRAPDEERSAVRAAFVRDLQRAADAIAITDSRLQALP